MTDLEICSVLRVADTSRRHTGTMRTPMTVHNIGRAKPQLPKVRCGLRKHRVGIGPAGAGVSLTCYLSKAAP
jgi:hypothetical protein